MRQLPGLAWLLRSSTARDAGVAMRSLPIDLPDGLQVCHSVNGLLVLSCLSLFVDSCCEASVHNTSPCG